jgi:hypothetical protein
LKPIEFLPPIFTIKPIFNNVDDDELIESFNELMEIMKKLQEILNKS